MSFDDVHSMLCVETVDNDLYDCIHLILRDLLTVREASKVSYMKPIIDRLEQEENPCIFSLNYDNVVELACDGRMEINYHIPYSSSLDKPKAKGLKTLDLFKLHGSLTFGPKRSWIRSEQGNAKLAITKMRIMPLSILDQYSQQSYIVAGSPDDKSFQRDRNADLSRLWSLCRNALKRIDLLVVAGYSFGDADVNSLILDWLEGDTKRTIWAINENKVDFCNHESTTVQELNKFVTNQRLIPFTAKCGEFWKTSL